MKGWLVAALVVLGAVTVWQRQHYTTALADWRDSARVVEARAGERAAELARARAAIVAYGEVSASAWDATDSLTRVADSLRGAKRPLPRVVPAACEVWAAEVSRCEAENAALRRALDSAKVARVADAAALDTAEGQLQSDSATVDDLRETLRDGVKVTGGCRMLRILPCPAVALEGSLRYPDFQRWRAAVDVDVPLGENVSAFARVEADSGSRLWVGGRWYPFGRGR